MDFITILPSPGFHGIQKYRPIVSWFLNDSTCHWVSQSCIKLQGKRHNSHYPRMDIWRRDLSHVSRVQQSKGSMLIFIIYVVFSLLDCMRHAETYPNTFNYGCSNRIVSILYRIWQQSCRSSAPNICQMNVMISSLTRGLSSPRTASLSQLQ